MKLRVFSQNIHKGLNAGNRSSILRDLKPAMHELNPHLSFLQEVVGENSDFKARLKDLADEPQHEFLKSADLIHVSYGKNVTYTEGHHGNAILSHLPISFERNTDLSVLSLPPRGLLHVIIPLKHLSHPLHAFCVHLGLVEIERRLQLRRIMHYIRSHINPLSPTLLVGDFNDWRNKLEDPLLKTLGMHEAFTHLHGQPARSFPSWSPLLRLDRVYFRNLKLVEAVVLSAKPWSELSDHLPLLVDFELIA